MGGTIYYIDYMQEGNKKGNLGFVQINDRGLQCSLRSVPSQCGNHLMIYGVNKQGERIALTKMTLYKGRGQIQWMWNQQLCRQECCAVFIPLYDKFYGRCIIQPYHKEAKAQADIDRKETVSVEIKDLRKDEKQKETGRKLEEVQTSSFIEELVPLAQDKWEQMYKMYPQVHIFPQVQSIVIKPKDLLVLTQVYQDLATNSFVLHAYYNYRQLLLMKYLKTKEYYLGVPGSYLEREKRVALLFGFDSFENGESYAQEKEERRAYPGCFGYYLKKVDI